MLSRSFFLALLASASAGSPMGAQTAPVSGAISALAAIPVGPLVGNQGFAVGANASAQYTLPSTPFVAISAEVGGLPKSAHTTVNNGAIPFDITNGSNAMIAGVGPRVSFPVGGGHVYVTGTAGIARLWASTAFVPRDPSAFGVNTSNITTPTTNFAWSGGAGVVLPLPGTRARAGLDLGVRYYNLGVATYAVPYIPFTALLVSGANGVFPDPDPPETRHARVTIVAPSAGIVLRL
jgi:hypothetical protein